ncbi:MucBP domain-containing protein [Pediococcus inopinatus]|uniref:MucBP domain-containing protein n=1 Tax=Pediococcus inopinatus TaxID=114090 RepID=A0ABZ0Q6H5_9LACO|nr:MucBP domain-containing protein [Pediococcus inopinatus]WPC22596.1 MucBP domain-containing protein [Pediococcus inopinatus]
MKQHYKMYKTTKGWLFAGIALLTFGASVTFGSYTVQADTDVSSAESESTVVASSASSSSAASAKSTTAESASSSSAVSDTSSNASSATLSSSTSSSSSSSSAASDTPSSAVSSASGSSETADDTSLASASEGSGASSKSSVASSATSASRIAPTAADLTNTSVLSEAVDVTTAAASVDLSADSVGYGSTGNFKIDFNFAGNAGDVFTITIPANSPAYSLDTNIEELPTSQGTTSIKKNADGSTTITYTVSDNAAHIAEFTLNAYTNEWGPVAAPMTEIGTTSKKITYTINGVAQTPVTFTQIIKPSANPTAPTRTNPDTTVTSVIPDTNYVYAFAINEANGVHDDGFPSKQVNSADNYGGTTVTLPVPTGFVLNASLTNQLNAFTDGTTITQPNGESGDIIITVPAGSGNQNYQGGVGYKIAGFYDVTQTSSNQKLTASGPATLTQIINAAGDKLTATADGTWTETIRASGDDGKDGNTSAKVSAVGNSSTTPNQLLLNSDASDDPTSLNSFTFSTISASDLTDATIIITIPDGFDATSVKLPAAGATTSSYLPGTTSYGYTVTLADGTVETGTIAAGATLTPTDNSSIRKLVLTPNFLAAGANSGNILEKGSQKIVVYGKLSATYDDGTAVLAGDTLTSTIEIAFGSTTETGGIEFTNATGTVTQTVVTTGVAKVSGYKHQTSQVPGKVAGTISLSMSGDTNQTANAVYEPIYYFVIPSGTTVSNITNVPAGGVISEFLADNGQEVVKIDYTGSGVSVTTQETYLLSIELTNNGDAMPGEYSFAMYVTSPTTPLQNKTPVTDTSFTDGDVNALSFYTDTWKIISVSSVYEASTAQGNQDTTAVKDGTSLTTEDSTLIFNDAIQNTSKKEATNVISLINLPTVGDSQGSQYTFDMTGAITVPAGGTVLYSTSQQTPPTSGQPSTSGYVTADQILDWSTVRSIIIEFDSIASNQTTGRIAIVGTTENFADQANKTGYLETALYSDGYMPVVSGAGTAAQITIIAPSTVELSKVSFPYDGNTKASEASGLTAKVTLSDGTSTTVSLDNSDIVLTVPDGTDAGSYTYKLSATGLAKVNEVAGTDTLSNPDTTGTIIITAAEVKASLNNDGFAFDGVTKASEDKGLIATVALKDGTTKEVSLTSDDIVVANDSTKGGEYSYTLSDTGLAKVQTAVGDNYVVNATDVTGTITIASPPAVSLGQDSFVYNGTSASGADDLSVVLVMPDGSRQTLKLTSGDITVTDDSANVGEYTYKLSADGLARLQAIVGTETITNPDATAKITITPATSIVDLNDVSINYDGTTKASDATGLTATATVVTADGDSKVVDLTSGDITATDDDTAPGDYTYTLNDAGLAAVQAAVGSNYTVTNATGTITITAIKAKVTLNDTSFTYDGTTKASQASGLTATVDGKVVDLTSEDITVANDGTNANGYKYSLSATGLQKVQSAVGSNYILNSDGVTGTITIDKAKVTITAPTLLKDYDGKPYAGDTSATISDKPAAGVDLQYSLTDISGDVNQGTYPITVTATDADNPNYIVSVVNGNLTIKAADTSVVLNPGGFSFDGTTKASEANNLTATVNGQKVDLTSSDIVMVTKDGTASGDYTYSLSATGLAKVQAAAGDNYTVNADATGTITITPVAAKVTFKFIDGQGNKIKADQIVDGNVGDAYSLTAPNIPGYAFESSDEPLSGTITGNETITLVYKNGTVAEETPAKVTFKFVDENGNTIKSDQVLNGYVGNAYDLTAPDIDGYAFASSDEPLNGKITGDETITLVYKNGTVATETPAKVTFKFVDENGNTIKSDQVLNGYVGNAYDLTAPNIDGYAFASSDEPLNGKITGDETITLVYKNGTVATETPAKVTFKFVDENGNTIKSDQVLNGYVGNAYDLTAPNIDGYAFASSDEPLNGKITGDETITLVYKNGTVATETPAKVTFKFVDENGNTIKSDQVLNGYVGNAYDLTAPTIAGYVFASSDEPLNGKITGDNTITLVYKHGEVAEETPAKVTFKFVDENGNTIKSDQVLNGFVGNAYDLTAPNIDGYAFESSDEPLDGKITGDETITLVYKSGTVATETPAKVTFKFVDENGNTIKSDQVLNGYVGNAYDMTAPTISGYTFLNADGLLSGTITGNATVTLIYKSKTSLPNGGGNGGDGTGTTPGKTPDNSGDNGSTNTVSGHKSNGSVEKTSFSTNATAQPQTRAALAQTKTQAKRLPQTGDSQVNPLAIIGMSLMATFFGLFGIKRKKHEQD